MQDSSQTPKEKKGSFFAELPITSLLERQHPIGYQEECGSVCALPITHKSILGKQSILVFRLEKQFMGISTQAIRHIATGRKIHFLPHAIHPCILGLVNIKGELRLCISLKHILDIKEDTSIVSIPGTEKLLLFETAVNAWALYVDEVFGIHEWSQNDLENVPETLIVSDKNFLKNMLQWEKKSIGFLDELLLGNYLKRSLS